MEYVSISKRFFAKLQPLLRIPMGGLTNYRVFIYANNSA